MRQKAAPSAMISKVIEIAFPEGAYAMKSVAQVEHCLNHMLEERATILARETGCIKRHRTFSGADLLQTLVFGWLGHPDASLETLASMAAIRQVQVTNTALHKRFTKSCAQFLHAV
jgi:hypothetical protein